MRAIGSRKSRSGNEAWRSMESHRRSNQSGCGCVHLQSYTKIILRSDERKKGWRWQGVPNKRFTLKSWELRASSMTGDFCFCFSFLFVIVAWLRFACGFRFEEITVSGLQPTLPTVSHFIVLIYMYIKQKQKQTNKKNVINIVWGLTPKRKLVLFFMLFTVLPFNYEWSERTLLFKNIIRIYFS